MTNDSEDGQVNERLNRSAWRSGRLMKFVGILLLAVLLFAPFLSGVSSTAIGNCILILLVVAVVWIIAQIRRRRNSD